ncbi:hypothetical protein [Pseudorhodoplanes sp.]|uniref:hypothetical protein n=1 Tax=Pseudorhodoplanes sp. TaxID=1934341 RepID=UPI002C8F9D30|nr:hypothetical protein [Pseudorhodoplanes sp.]HWV55306.1 hypothetical protein [Pseudorhodoplanes sp.]
MVSDLVATFALSKDYARIVWRYVYLHWNTFKRAFSSDLVIARAMLALAPDKAIGRPYRSDGSRLENLNVTPDYRFAAASGYQIIEPLLRRDIERLKRLVDQPGAPRSVVIYESPLAPPVAAKLGDSPSAAAAHYRNVIARACRDNNLDCLLNRSVALRQSDNVVWDDATHPPATALGAAITAITENAGSCGKAAR